MTIRAVVIGAGWAGEGHTKALMSVGVNVVALCARTPEPLRWMAEILGVPEVRFDWLTALNEFQPDILAIATPAGSHAEIVKAAAQMGCHLLCEKPLATNASEARRMLLAVERAGVKHAYGATSRYAPALVYARSLLNDGLIGQVREIESIARYNISPLRPYHWFHQVSQGGGLLNALFTHKLDQVLYATGGIVQAVAGEERQLINQAPVGVEVHDFRDFIGKKAMVSPEQAASGEWREVTADLAYTVMIRLSMSDQCMTSALFQASSMAVSPVPNYLAFYGSEGTLHLTGRNAPNLIQHFDNEQQEWVEIPVPEEVNKMYPQVSDTVQRDWNQLAKEFVAHVRGEEYTGYPTFRDGWFAVEAMEIVRNGGGWTQIPESPIGLNNDRSSYVQE